VKRFAKAFVNLVSSTVRASSVLMENGADRLTKYANKNHPTEGGAKAT
jgi:hypothetical protein